MSKKEQHPNDHKGSDTMFAVSGRNQLELIAIADNKANMIAGISILLIVMVIAVFSTGDPEYSGSVLNQIEFVLPLGILLVFCCVSAICALMALKPKIIRAKKEGRSAIFFSNYYRKTLEEYKAEMYEMMDSEQNIYDHMLKDMYFNGLVLKRKYSLLSFAYNIFLLSIVLSVSSFVIAIIV